jgi:pre-mRNA-processing factor 6
LDLPLPTLGSSFLALSNARLEVPERAKAVLNKARKAVPTSDEIWIAAGRLLEQEASLPAKTPEERVKELEVVDCQWLLKRNG